MENLYQDNYLEITYEQEKKQIVSKWFLPFSAKDEDFKQRMLIFADWVEKKNPECVYTDVSATHYILVPEIQDWVNGFLPKIYKQVGLKKLAVLANKDFLTQMALEQSIKDDEEAAYITQYFDNESDVNTWLEED